MGLESYEDLTSPEEGGSEKGQESTKESQEKREKASKALAGIKRTRKDEKKATNENTLLYDIIVDLLKEQRYDSLLPFLIDLIHVGAPSSMILGVISLIFDEAVYVIRYDLSASTDDKDRIRAQARAFKADFSYDKTEERVVFDDNDIDAAVKKRINEWIEDIIRIMTHDPSSIVTKRFLQSMESDPYRGATLEYITQVLICFLDGINLEIGKGKAVLYGRFIVGEIITKLRGLDLEEIET